MRESFGTDTENSHRSPLPSVGIPLFSEDRRRARLHRALLWSSGGLLVCLALGAAWVAAGMPTPWSNASHGKKNGSEHPRAELTESVPGGASAAQAAAGEGPAPAEAEDGEHAIAVASGDWTRWDFGKARGFREALSRAPMSKALLTSLEKAVSEVMDFRRCHADDRLAVQWDARGEPTRFEYHGGRTWYVKASRVGDFWNAKRHELPVTTKVVARGGKIRSSLGQAFVDAGLGRSVVGTFVTAFQRVADFARDARSGDAFRVLVEKRFLNGDFLGYGDVLAMQYAGKRTGALGAYRYEARSAEPGYYDDKGRSVHGGWLRVPCHYDRISSRFDPKRMHPVLKRVVPHNGVDYAAPVGSRVWAAAAGKVVFVGKKGANGNLVTIRHQNGYHSSYAHLSRFARGLRRGNSVKRGDVIGFVGSTGRSTGPHLHFGLKRGGRFLDPLKIIHGPGEQLTGADMVRFRKRRQRLLTRLSAVPLVRGEDGAGGSMPSPPDSPLD